MHQKFFSPSAPFYTFGLSNIILYFGNKCKSALSFIIHPTNQSIKGKKRMHQMGWRSQNLAREKDGSKYFPLKMCWVSSLLAPSVQWIPSQLMYDAGSEQDTAFTGRPLIVPLLPQCMLYWKLYLPPIPQHALVVALNPTFI